MKQDWFGKVLRFLMSAVVVIGAVCFVSLTAAAVSSVGTEEALQRAVAAGNDVKLTASIELTDTITVPAGQSLKLDLNGKTLDRAVSTVTENGSVIVVESGATLTLSDATNNTGTITGGAAMNGGGICNYGTLTIENGTITGNKALDETGGLGGGIYNAAGAVLTIKGGTFTDNRARLGGGIYNEDGAAMSILQGTFKKKTATIVTNVTTNAAVTGNKATQNGGGIYNAGAFNVQDAPKLAGNTGEDICFAENAKITFTGALTSTEKIAVLALGTNPVITSGFPFSAPGELFRPAAGSGVMMLDADGEVRFRTDANTTVQTFDNGIMTSTEDLGSAKSAWNKAAGYAKAGKKAVIILGADWEHDEQLIIDANTNLTLDLNGHYVKRTRNYEQKSDGEVFRVKEGAVFTVKDSDPDRKSYDGLRGGVITGGASTNSAGGIYLEKNAALYMYGGTIYECVTCEDGGAINASAANTTVFMQDARIFFCQTIDSFDTCSGGGIKIGEKGKLTLENVAIEDCYSENSGGALYIRSQGNTKVRLKNVLFSGNKAYDHGAAIYLNTNTEIDFRADGCTFVGNMAQERGAVYLNGTNAGKENPIIFNDCTFRSNYAGNNGSVFYDDCDGLILTNCTITDNTVGSDNMCGAVYVRYKNNISVGGLTVIRDNSTGHRTCKNLLLEREANEYAYIKSAGLENGSYIGFCMETDGRGSSAAFSPIRELSEYQMQYFHPENGTLAFETERTENVPLALASVVGNGSLVILIVIVLAFAGVLVAALIMKKKKGADDGEDDA